jgi:ribosome-binding protein aMBF1 (putative translation factor)
MPFKKLNVQKIINKKIKTDDKFAAAYSEVENEYKLIREVVKARKEQGLTQQELAEMVGVKQQVISRFEREKHIPTLDNFLKILDGVGLELKLEKKQDRH